MVNVSKKAAEKFNDVRKKSKNPDDLMIRVSFGGFGWGGPTLQLTLDESKNENDIISESEGIKVVYESELEDYLNGSVINYSDSWFSRGFTIEGGNLSSC